jgi:hypothetical protein
MNKAAVEILEDAQPYLNAAQKAVSELKRSPFFRADRASDSLMCPELCADVIEKNLCALDHMLYVAAETLRAVALVRKPGEL